MAAHVDRSIVVDVPVRTTFDRWTRFSDFPRGAAGVGRRDPRGSSRREDRLGGGERGGERRSGVLRGRRQYPHPGSADARLRARGPRGAPWRRPRRGRASNGRRPRPFQAPRREPHTSPCRRSHPSRRHGLGDRSSRRPDHGAPPRSGYDSAQAGLGHPASAADRCTNLING
jgi:hypothetical protein